MARLNIAPTKSNYLVLKKQLAFAEEGYDLLDQKRRILIMELMSRMDRARELERASLEALARAHAALREATLETGSAAVERAAVGAKPAPDFTLVARHLMGLTIPQVTFPAAPASTRLGVNGVSVNTDTAQRRFVELLPLLAELAELQNALMRLARELRKTQRRCNALSKIFIPAYRETITYISGTLEERERESLTILKIIRNRLLQPDQESQGN